MLNIFGTLIDVRKLNNVTVEHFWLLLHVRPNYILSTSNDIHTDGARAKTGGHKAVRQSGETGDSREEEVGDIRQSGETGDSREEEVGDIRQSGETGDSREEEVGDIRQSGETGDSRKEEVGT